MASKTSPILYLGHARHGGSHRCDDCGFYSRHDDNRQCELNPDYEYSGAKYHPPKEGVLPRNHPAAVCCDKHPMWDNVEEK